MFQPVTAEATKLYMEAGLGSMTQYKLGNKVNSWGDAQSLCQTSAGELLALYLNN